MALLLVIIVALLVAAAADMRINSHTGTKTHSRAGRPPSHSGMRRRTRCHGYGRLAPQQNGTTTAKWWWE